jgi:heme/copper-type cytochrome/quinol oxidase subunit 1
MTVTEAPPEASTEANDAPTGPAQRADPRGLTAVLGTGDHKTIGRLWIGSSLVFLLVTVVTGVLVGLERIDPSSADVLSTDALQILAGYRISSLFLVAIPLFLGIATYITPLQVGAPALAFPRAAAAAMWTWLLGSGLLLASLALGGGPQGDEPDMVDLWFASWGLVLVGLALGTICVVVTVVALRTPDMTLDRVPFFSWSMLVAGTLWLVTLPVVGASLLLGYVDHRYGQLSFGEPDALFSHVAWVFDQPAAYIAAIPVLGVLAEIGPVVAGREQRSHRAQLGAIAAFGILSFGAWAQPAISTEFADSPLYIGMAFAIGVPLLALVGGVVGTVRRGRRSAVAPFMLAFVAAGLLLLAVLAGAVSTIESLDLLGTSWQTAQDDLIWIAAVTGGLAALFWWAPKIWGRMVSAATGHALAALLLVGGVVLAVPLAIAGALDQPAGAFEFEARDGIEALNTISAVGAVIIALAALLTVYALSRALAGGRPDERTDVADPWGGQTLEWSTASPPPVDNFDGAIAEVSSATPLFEDPGDPDDDGESA